MLQFKNLKPTVFFLIILCSTFSFAQVKLNNQVVDFGFESPIESASVYIKNTAIGTVTNADGNFSLQVPIENVNDTLVFSSIGYSTVKIAIPEYNPDEVIYLDEQVAALDEVMIDSEPRPVTGNEIMLKALEKLPETMPEYSFLQKGFLRHKERNKDEFKWLIESAITVYDSGYTANSKEHLKVNVDQVRKSYDLRTLDSLFTHYSYLKNNTYISFRSKNLRRDTIKKSSLIKSIKWNDTRVNGLQNIFQGKLNVFRNVNGNKALFGKDILDHHQFELDTILVDNDRKLYKLKINEGAEFVGLDTKGIYNEGYNAEGWVYIYYDNYAIKKLEYALIPASKEQKMRSKRLLKSKVNHKLVITYKEFQDKMYPSYIYYETPKLVNVGFKPVKKVSKGDVAKFNEKRFYYTVQEILFTDIITETEKVKAVSTKKWDMDIFSPKPYNRAFWNTYNVLLESKEEQKLIEDLTQRARLYRE